LFLLLLFGSVFHFISSPFLGFPPHHHSHSFQKKERAATMINNASPTTPTKDISATWAGGGGTSTAMHASNSQAALQSADEKINAGKLGMKEN
jgi:hypothetical protein